MSSQLFGPNDPWLPDNTRAVWGERDGRPKQQFALAAKTANGSHANENFAELPSWVVVLLRLQRLLAIRT